jgi:hypothetical protein
VLGVLPIAAANVASHFVVRAKSGRRGVATRAVLGARRSELLLHDLGESVLVAATALAVALVFACGAMQIFVALATTGYPRLGGVALTRGGNLKEEPVTAADREVA